MLKRPWMLVILIASLSAVACGAESTRSDADIYVRGSNPGWTAVLYTTTSLSSTPRDGDAYILCNEKTGEVKVVTLEVSDWYFTPVGSRPVTNRNSSADISLYCGDKDSAAGKLADIQAIIKDSPGNTDQYTLAERYRKIVVRLEGDE